MKRQGTVSRSFSFLPETSFKIRTGKMEQRFSDGKLTSAFSDPSIYHGRDQSQSKRQNTRDGFHVRPDLRSPPDEKILYLPVIKYAFISVVLEKPSGRMSVQSRRSGYASISCEVSDALMLPATGADRDAQNPSYVVGILSTSCREGCQSRTQVRRTAGEQTGMTRPGK